MCTAANFFYSAYTIDARLHLIVLSAPRRQPMAVPPGGRSSLQEKMRAVEGASGGALLNLAGSVCQRVPITSGITARAG